MIRYVDTRGVVESPCTFTKTVLQGIAPGGGLFVPERLPELTMDQIIALADLPYHARAAIVFDAFELDVATTITQDIVARAYGINFNHPEIAPVVEVAPGRHVLELWHGPTLAFKDMALQCMPGYFSEALGQAHASGTTTLDYLILVATSGDTGVAALSGFADRNHTRICVYYPDAGVSALQELQMVTQPGFNLSVFRVAGDFDACQNSVKAVFDDPGFATELAERHRLALSSANSINWARLLPQIVYYLSGYADLVARGAVAGGDPVDICVPTGNFGNLLGAWYARRMGLPVERLICASNSNNVLFDFIDSGVYSVVDRPLVKTPSPSMDILISSNLERLLFDLTGDPRRIAEWMRTLKAERRFAVDDATRKALRASFVGTWVDNDTCLEVIGRVHRERSYLIDPHTAVAWEAAERFAGDAPVLIAGTAHWSKFADDVLRGLTGIKADESLNVVNEFEHLERVIDLAPGTKIPRQLRAVRARPRRFDTCVEPGREPVEDSLRGWLARRR